MSKNGLRFARVEDMPEGMRKLLAGQGTGVEQVSRIVDRMTAPAAAAPAAAAPAAKRSKYGNQITTVDGIRFDSKREANYYQQLKLRQQAGEVWFWLRQVPVHLPGGTKYVLDFLVFLRSGDFQFVDVKGRETKEFRIKKREVEHHYPFRILLA